MSNYTLSIACVIAAAAGVAPAQTTNTPPDTPANSPTLFVEGLDIQAIVNTDFARYHAGSTTAISMSTTACNPGRVVGIWEAVPDPDHPLICQMYCRLLDNRLEQINDWSYVKHSFSSTNSGGCSTGPCIDPGSGARLGLNCSDTYGSSLNASLTYLGPPHEINPFTGAWLMVGSHFDRGYPDVGFPQNMDGSRNNIVAPNDVLFRCQIPDAKVGTPGARYFAQCFYIHQWEPEKNRENNLVSREIRLTGSGATSLSSMQWSSVLHRWPGARVESAANEDASGIARDGRFYVGVHVTRLADGWYRYEYAVHNRDNHGRAAQLRVPICPTGRTRNTGFKDVDLTAANDWTFLRQGDDLVWDAQAGNAQPWNTVFNFWFDADAAPAGGAIELVQANPQYAAATSVIVVNNAPTLSTDTWIAAGCGGPDLWPTGPATIPSPSRQFRMTGVAATASCGVLLSDGLSIAPVFGCDFMIPDIPATLSATAVGGVATFGFGVPNNPSLEGVDLFLQGVELQVGGALLGVADLSNVVQTRIGNALRGCQ